MCSWGSMDPGFEGKGAGRGVMWPYTEIISTALANIGCSGGSLPVWG